MTALERRDTAGSSWSLVVPPPAPVEWTLYSAVTRTGRIVAELPFIGVPRWQAGVNDRGSIEVTIPLHQSMITVSDLRQALTPWRYSLVIVAGDWVAQAGPITGWSSISQSDGTITVRASGLWAMQDARMLLPPDTYGHGTSVTDPAADTNLGPTSLNSIIKALVWQGEQRTAGDLPIVYEADIAGSNVRNYPGYDLATVGERIYDITQLEAGPDIEFRPRLTLDRDGVEWILRTGRPYLRQSGDPHVWDSGEGLMELDASVDAGDMSNSIFIRGQGTERGLRVGIRTVNPDPAWPLLESVVTEHSSVTEPSTLDSYARSYLALRQEPVEMWTAEVRAAGPPALGTWLPGDDCIITLTDHPWYPDGDYPRRLLTMGNGSSLDSISVGFAPRQGGL